MPSGKSTYFAQKVLDQQFGLAAFTPPATVHVALFTVTPGAGNTGTEVSGSNYSRVAVAMNSTNWSRTGTTVTNLTQILFPVFSGAVATVVAVGLYDAATGGNLIWFSDLAAPYQKSFAANDQAVYPAGSITVTEA